MMEVDSGTGTAEAKPGKRRHLRRAVDVTWLLLSFGLRLAAGMAVLILLARLLGRESFGEFAYCLALATLFAVPANFGLGTFVLREIGVDRQRYAATMGAALTTKLLICGLVLLAGGVMLVFLQPALRLPFALLLLAQLGDSFAEFFNLGFRPGSHYRAEARTAVVTSSVHLALMGAIISVTSPSATVAASLFCLSRVLGCAWIWLQTRKLEAPLRAAPLSTVPALVRNSRAYAFELFQFTAYAQLDSMFINFHLGIVEVGLYQAGMKLVEGGARLAPVLAQYALPALTQRLQSPAAAGGAVLRTVLVFGLMGGMGAALLALGADYIINSLYGAQYQALHGLLPVFGLMLFLRYLETAGGVAVVAAGLQHVKVWFVSLQLVLMLALGPWALHRWGLQGWQWIACLGLGFTIAIYIAIYLGRPRAAKPATAWSDTSTESAET